MTHPAQGAVQTRHGARVLHRYRPSTSQAGAQGSVHAGARAVCHGSWQRVGIGEVAASATPSILHAVLGSCVSVCLYDPVERIGGMNHILIPTSGSDCCNAARGGVQAMELLINAMMKQGAERRRLVAKAFGGANVLPGFTPPTVGELNAQFVHEFLATERIPLLAERLGGQYALNLRFDTASGRAKIRAVTKSHLTAIVRDEDSYYHTDLTNRFHVEEPTLFWRLPGEG